MFNKIFRRLFVHIDLYGIDLRTIGMFEETDLPEYTFSTIADVSGMHTLRSLIDERGDKFKLAARERWRSGDFLCFCFIERSSGKAAYSRWLRKGSFFHDRFKRTIRLDADEAFTMDSYTPREFRGRGLHTEMNKRMLNYCRKELKLSRVFLVILRGVEFSHLHQTVGELGYKRIRSRLYFKSGSLKAIIGKLRGARA